MRSTTSLRTYSRPAIFFHWAIALLIGVAYLAIEIRGPKGSVDRAFWNDVHHWAGCLVLLLAIARVLWRLWHGVPPEIESARVLKFLARLVHLALYLFIFVQPLLGILMINLGGHPVTLAGIGLHLQLTGADKAAGHAIHSVHVWLGNAFYWVIGLHALAAIFHHAVFRDETLRRMLGMSRSGGLER